jgi:hypothetical protein
MTIYDATPTTEPQLDQDYPAVYRVVKWVRILTVTAAPTFGLLWTYTMLHPTYAHGELVFGQN